MGWWADAACVYTDPDVFFQKETTRQAKAICAGCPVQLECLSAAMTEELPSEGESELENRDNRHGVRGGKRALERWQYAFPEIAEADMGKRRAKEAARRQRAKGLAA